MCYWQILYVLIKNDREVKLKKYGSIIRSITVFPIYAAM